MEVVRAFGNGDEVNVGSSSIGFCAADGRGSSGVEFVVEGVITYRSRISPGEGDQNEILAVAKMTQSCCLRRGIRY